MQLTLFRAPKGMKISMTCPSFNLSTRGSDKSFFQVNTHILYERSLRKLSYSHLSQSLETFYSYYGSELAGKTLRTRRHIATYYFLSNNVRLREDGNQYGFNCTYSFVDKKLQWVNKLETWQVTWPTIDRIVKFRSSFTRVTCQCHFQNWRLL